MFHIKDDQRSRKSASQIYTAMLGLIGGRGLGKASISDICKAAGVSRATFYRSFDTTIDVLRWKCSLFFTDMMKSYLQTLQVRPETEDSLLLFVLRFCFSDIRIIEILLAQGRPDIIYDCFQECIRLMLENYRSRGMNFDGIRNDYFVSIRTGYLIGILVTWIRNGKRESAEEVCSIVKAQHELVAKSGMIF
jgi:AcrR family transcriptional regulator